MRREFITLLGGVAARLGDCVRRIGVLLGSDENDPEPKTNISAFMTRVCN
jgi:hypothetical protein